MSKITPPWGPLRPVPVRRRRAFRPLSRRRRRPRGSPFRRARQGISLLFLTYVALFLLTVVGLPSFLHLFARPGTTTPAAPEAPPTDGPAREVELSIPVYLTREERILTLPLEEYVAGVVAAEMPAEFELEALKAQAVAARTYIVQRLMEGDFSDAPEGAVVTDGENHQVYLTDDALKERWGMGYARKKERIDEAVKATRGQILTYQGRPIHATFFSTSNGYTEEAGAYWDGGPFPYLKSVPSPWDVESPYFLTTVTLTVEEFLQKLHLEPGMAAGAGQAEWVQVTSRTASGRIAQVRVGEVVFTGRQFRELLGLHSSDVEIELMGDQVRLTTRGYGHGVGMSQYGANGMAKEGRTAAEILAYYYPGTEMADYREWVRPSPARPQEEGDVRRSAIRNIPSGSMKQAKSGETSS